MGMQAPIIVRSYSTLTPVFTQMPSTLGCKLIGCQSAAATPTRLSELTPLISTLQSKAQISAPLEDLQVLPMASTDQAAVSIMAMVARPMPLFLGFRLRGLDTNMFRCLWPVLERQMPRCLSQQIQALPFLWPSIWL